MSQTAIAERITTSAPTIDLSQAPALPSTALTPQQMIYQLIASGAPVESVREMMAMSKELAADAARKAFDEAMSDAKGDIPVIVKNRMVDHAHKNGGGRTTYRHEDLAEIARTIDPILAKHGLSYRFRATSEPNQPISVTCRITHRGGHAEETTISGGRDDSGSKNSLQQMGSTITYLQRYTLKLALGLAAAADDDGAKADETASEAITDEQLTKLRAIADEVGGDVPRLCTYFKVDSLPNLPASRFAEAVEIMERKRKAAAK